MSLAHAMPDARFDAEGVAAPESAVLETIPDPDGIGFPPLDPESDEPEMEGYLHLTQMLLLLSSLELFWKDRNDFFAAGNLTIFYSPRQLKSEHFRGPDFFVVLGTERKPRKSWTPWHENGLYPNLIVEILSESTEKIDRGLKKQIYQDIFRTQDYFWFDPETQELAGFHLVDGRYAPLEPNARGRLTSAQVGLDLGVHEGQLRFFTPEGVLLPGPRELAQQAEAAEQQAEAAEQKAEAAEQRADRLAEKLRALGIDPDTLK